MKLKITKKTTLGKLPNGSLFLTEDLKTLCMKTEYYNDNGSSQSYIVDSGCAFWGGAKSGKEQLDIVVWRVKVKNKKKFS